MCIKAKQLFVKIVHFMLPLVKGHQLGIKKAALLYMYVEIGLATGDYI